MLIYAPKETTSPNEKRAALAPLLAERLVKRGHSVYVEHGIGEMSYFSDSEYLAAGVNVVGSYPENVDLLLKVGKPSKGDLRKLKPGELIVGILGLNKDKSLLEKLSSAGVTALDMARVPRIARAQSLDVISSQLSISGYKAVLIAADSIGRYFPMLITAAGTLPPIKVMVLGAGVAGLQAIATARRLGAVVTAFDVRAAAAEQVASVGGIFVSPPNSNDLETTSGYARAQTEQEQERIMQFLIPYIIESDVVITTASIPDRPAPKLISKDTVKQMRAGSVIVDIAAETGGNCEATEQNKVVHINNVQIHGPINLPSQVASHATLLYSHNIFSLISTISDSEGNAVIDLDDEVISSMCVVHNGKVQL